MGASVDFGFGGLVIRVPPSDFLLKLQDGTCSMGAQERGSDADSILGDTFLRGAYGKCFLFFSSLPPSGLDAEGGRGGFWIL